MMEDDQKFEGGSFASELLGDLKKIIRMQHCVIAALTVALACLSLHKDYGKKTACKKPTG